MKKATRAKLERSGWTVGDASAFLDLSEAEIQYIDMKLALARALREEREGSGMTQTDVARHVGSSQSRVAKMEAADSSVSIDLLVRSLLKLGVSRARVAAALEGTRKRRAG